MIYFAQSHDEAHPDAAALPELQQALHRCGDWWAHPEVGHHLVPQCARTFVNVIVYIFFFRLT